MAVVQEQLSFLCKRRGETQRGSFARILPKIYVGIVSRFYEFKRKIIHLIFFCRLRYDFLLLFFVYSKFNTIFNSNLQTNCI